MDTTARIFVIGVATAFGSGLIAAAANHAHPVALGGGIGLLAMALCHVLLTLRAD